ncbi:MAG: hypothetical protein JAY85_08655 [Candidatus Thiodiazotropha weberae]|uniref:Uncharacterized protein n=1 Tax=Candidatus Thiodiazotropha endoloripes TaxID=1818881 RepID=A0A1E2USU9_9GAMM|nr:hypothetical protein [Candidatus Thiodiazotropha endoloripes]MCG7898515.1 hypothetical protein [Candidatus Thiodiazotropha weberae]ODB86622.1 hypothetical protein A3195_13580 [Candidatus Thiodiazotropha endoloripes]ODB88652.1 hypothetical protein A3193_07370 [Candidatus Thiodiazotropha endoloripes]ODB97741.1 hypothetical protein A3196_13810 [Candidatus Thiodiazotropha endoloripes]
MKKLLLTIAVALMAATSLAAQDDHADHDHTSGHASEGEEYHLGQTSLAGTHYQVTLYDEINPGTEAVISIEVEQGKAPSELRTWVGVKNGRGSVKTLLQADSYGHYHGHLEVPAKLPEGSAIWIDVRTESGRKRGAVRILETDHTH